MTELKIPPPPKIFFYFLTFPSSSTVSNYKSFEYLDVFTDLLANNLVQVGPERQKCEFTVFEKIGWGNPPKKGKAKARSDLKSCLPTLDLYHQDFCRYLNLVSQMVHILV